MILSNIYAVNGTRNHRTSDNTVGDAAIRSDNNARPARSLQAPSRSSAVRFVRSISINERFNSMEKLKLAATARGEHAAGGEVR